MGEVLHDIDVNQDYNMFVNKFQQLYDECIPLQKCNSKRKRDPKLSWITKGLLKSINHKLYKDYVKCPSNNKQQKFKLTEINYMA